MVKCLARLNIVDQKSMGSNPKYSPSAAHEEELGSKRQDSSGELFHTHKPVNIRSLAGYSKVLRCLHL